jgi:hypothetical protein
MLAMYKNALVVLALIVATAALSILATKGVSAQAGENGRFSIQLGNTGTIGYVVDTQTGDANIYYVSSQYQINRHGFHWQDGPQ